MFFNLRQKRSMSLGSSTGKSLAVMLEPGHYAKVGSHEHGTTAKRAESREKGIRSRKPFDQLLEVIGHRPYHSLMLAQT